jgi:hypothetical protein
VGGAEQYGCGGVVQRLGQRMILTGIFHRTRNSTEAHLTIMFFALAVLYHESALS